MHDYELDNLEKRLGSIMEKFSRLKHCDRNYEIFGASCHEYQFNKVIDKTSIDEFEAKFNVQLPGDYKLFLLEVGNGGAGPFYGVLPFEKCLFSDIDYPNAKFVLNPSLPFPYHEEWNMDNPLNGEDDEQDEQLEAFEKEYFDDKHANGTIRICNYGCGHFINLIVKGEEYSHIWSDDRASDFGIYPFRDFNYHDQARLTFFDWYEGWIEKSLSELTQNQ